MIDWCTPRSWPWCVQTTYQSYSDGSVYWAFYRGKKIKRKSEDALIDEIKRRTERDNHPFLFTITLDPQPPGGAE